MEPESHSEAERRHYFRIDDSVSLSYQLVQADQLQQRIEALDKELDSSFTVVSSLAAITQQMSGVMHQLDAKRPEIASYLKSLDKKIDILGRAFLAQTTDLLEQPVRSVNISANGISFDALEEARPGDLLEIKILLMPAFIGVLAIAEVVGCESKCLDTEPGVYHLRLKFAHLRDGDRDVLIQHVIRRQSSELRKRREAREQSGSKAD